MPALAQGAATSSHADCRTLLERLNTLMAIYKTAAAEDLKNDPLDRAMDRARREALAGRKEATITMVGYTSLVGARPGSYPVTVIRQVCTFAEKNSLPLHVATCAYFHTLNPMGETDARAGAARRMIARFEGLKDAPGEIAGHVGVLKACLPQKE